MRLEAAARQLEVQAQDAGRELLSEIQLAEMVVVASCGAAAAVGRAIDWTSAEDEIAHAHGHLAYLQSLTRETGAAWQRRLDRLRAELRDCRHAPQDLVARVLTAVLG